VADAEVAARMFDARQALETKERERLTLEELGRRIAEAEGRAEKPYAAAVVKRWLEGDAEPGTMGTWRAIAAVFGVTVGWLANGELPMHAPAPAPTPPLEMFRELRTGDDLRDVLGEQKGKKKRSNDAG
jgi:hypothetical protein